MRDRLKEFINKFEELDFCIPPDWWIEHLADHLLANGVIVPPVKVGHTVYCIRYDKSRKLFVKPLAVNSITVWGDGGFSVFTTKEDTLGKTVFLTREDAEKALAERKKG